MIIVSVTVEPGELMTSAELISLLERANRLAAVAGRPDTMERLARARARVAGRQIRIVVVGPPGQGATSLVQVLQPAAAGWLPGASFAGAPGRARPSQPSVPEPGSADVALFVTEAGHEYGPAELTRWRRCGRKAPRWLARSPRSTFSQWAEGQRANRRQLTAAHLDSPAIPLLPVSAALCERGRQRGDESLTVPLGCRSCWSSCVTRSRPGPTRACATRCSARCGPWPIS